MRLAEDYLNCYLTVDIRSVERRKRRIAITE